MAWIYAIPVWLFAICVIAASVALSAAGVLITRRLFPHGDQITHNDVAGPIVSTLGTILAVILSFMVIAVWQEYDAAAATVQSEVNAICDLYHDASTLPQPLKGDVQTELARYVHVVVHDEWPLMREGRNSAAAHVQAFRVLKIVAALKTHGAEQDAMRTDMVSLTHIFNDSRRQRLFDNSQAIPAIMWWILLFISVVTIASAYLFRVANVHAHIIMTSALTGVIAAILILIAQFDLPFRGDIQIQPTAFSHALTAIAEDPPNSEYSPSAPR
ncbi:MAG TPA: hypothetical protein VGN11_11490 [Candidatus Baltobacteraceae bacterium]|nr:hypothetical protein [Candidatus Baltobacteraceae bacterium]